VADYSEADQFTTLNRVSTVGAMILGMAIVPFMWNVWTSLRKGQRAPDNPWQGHTLEWATSSPPPHGNFVALPPIESERPVWDYYDGYREELGEKVDEP
jgi:cytochrome c oxidase subunit 1